MPVSLKRTRSFVQTDSPSSDLKSPHKSKVRRVDTGWGVFSGISTLLGFTNEEKRELLHVVLLMFFFLNVISHTRSVLPSAASPAAAYPSPDPTDPELEPDEDPEIKIIHYRPLPKNVAPRSETRAFPSLPQPLPPLHRPFASGWVKKTPMFASEVRFR
jgi:hypothetical protein